jgi:dihydrofolate reductase
MKVAIICKISLDGYINKPDQGKLDWGSRKDMEFFAAETRNAGVAIMGQTTFDTLPNPLPDRLNVVVTRELKENNENVWHTSETPQAILAALKADGHDYVAVTGGSIINGLFMNAGVVTDMYITITPHVFGAGVPLFAELEHGLDLELIDSRPMGPGEILNHYKVLRNEA